MIGGTGGEGTLLSLCTFGSIRTLLFYFYLHFLAINIISF